MELQDLQFFVEVARKQSFTRAAATLHVGQPAVSHRIALLEESLGKPLFARHRHGVGLTQAGKTFLAYAERILTLVDESQSVVSAVHTNRLKVRIAGPSSINAYLLPSIVCRLAEKGHDVRLHDVHSHEVMQHVLDGTADVGFVIDIPNQPGIRRQLLLQDPIICVAANKHPAAGRTLSISDLRSHAIVSYPFSYEYDLLFGYIRGSLNNKSMNTLEVTPVESVKGVLRTGNYISFVPQMTVEREILTGELVQILISDLPVYTWNVSVIYRDRKEISDSVHAVLETISL